MRPMMRRLLTVLVAPFAGYLVFSVGAWRVGPLLGIQGRNLAFLRSGLLVLGAVAVTVVVWFLVQRVRRSTRGAVADEIDAAFKLAAQRLAAARGVSVRSLRDLPLILVLGPEGSAKTTTILQAGLEPDLLAGEPHRGAAVAPTKDVNLWYAHGVLLAEVGGKLLSNPDAWEHLASKLRPKRLGAVLAGKAQPPRAALLCFSCEDLVGDDSEKLRTTAGVLRERLSVASRTLGIRLPLYVVLTKSDRIRNFPEFVRELTSEEVQHALGCTLPLALATDVGAYADREYQRLQGAMESVLSSLSLQRLRILPRVNTQEERNAAYEFPRELRKLTPRVVEFLVELCRPRHLEVSPFVRGLYLTGVRPVVIDAASPAAAPTRVPQWLFLSGLFHDVVRKDRVALGMMQAGHGLRQLRRLAFGSLSAVGLVVLGGTSVSFLSNRGLANRVTRAAEATALLESTVPLPQALAALDDLRKELVVLIRQRDEGPPLRRRWGLYRGDELTTQARRIYWTQFQTRLLGRIRDSLRTELRALAMNAEQTTFDSAFSLVATYLSVTSRPDQLSADSTVRLNSRSPETRMFVGSDRDLVLQQLAFYGLALCAGDELCQTESDRTVAGPACAMLKDLKDENRVYQEFLRRVASQGQAVQFTSSLLRNPHEVPAEFTSAAWTEAHQAFTVGDVSSQSEDWVYRGIQCEVAEQQDVASLTRTVHQRYDDEYVTHWRQFLASGVVGVAQRVDAAGDALRTLGDFRSPLLQMLALVSANTGGSSDSTVLQSVFQPAHVVIPPIQGSGLLNEANSPYAGALTSLGDELKSMAASNNDPAARDAALGKAQDARQAATQLTSKFSAIDSASEVGGSVKRLLEAPIAQVERFLQGLPRAQAGESVRQFCQSFDQVASRYPFNAAGPPATPQQVVGMFHPTDGALARLANEGLRDVLQKRVNTWELVSGSSGVSRTFVDFFNRASRVGEALFDSQGQGPRLQFTVRRLSPAPGTNEVTLTIGGIAVTRTSSNATVSQNIEWVTQEARTSVASLRVSAGGSRVAGLDFEETWGIFRLFGRATWREESGNTYRLLWNVPGDGQNYEVDARITLIGAPVLDPRHLAGLRCPR